MTDSHRPKRLLSRLFAWLFALLLVAEAAGTSFYVSQFKDLFVEFGSELPFLTTAVLMGAWLIWVLPVIAVAVILSASVRENRKLPLVSVLLILGVLWVPVTIYGLYLPVWELSEVNGA